MPSIVRGVKMFSAVQICGVRVHALSRAELFSAMLAESASPRCVMYANAHAINLAQRDAAFRNALNTADVVFCDGRGVQWAAELLGGRLPERMTPPDWIQAFTAECVAKHWGIYLLGGSPGVANAAAQKLTAAWPTLQCETHHGFFADDTTTHIIDAINRSGAKVLLVGMSMPKQETWALKNAHHLNVATIVTVGALFDYISGSVTRGPSWMTDNGLEWLARMFVEPRRLGKRYLLGNPLFVMHVLRDWLQRKTGRRLTPNRKS